MRIRGGGWEGTGRWDAAPLVREGHLLPPKKEMSPPFNPGLGPPMENGKQPQAYSHLTQPTDTILTHAHSNIESLEEGKSLGVYEDSEHEYVPQHVQEFWVPRPWE